jgi:hypothetical protein
MSSRNPGQRHGTAGLDQLGPVWRGPPSGPGELSLAGRSMGKPHSISSRVANSTGHRPKRPITLPKINLPEVGS